MTGRRLGHYQIVERLGSGGMGVVYKAYDPKLRRYVAIKALSSEQQGSEDSRSRLLREARAASALNHPHIVTIYDVRTEGEEDYIVMELVTGKTLDELIPAGGMEVEEALRIAAQIIDGLQGAHDAGIVHRDLKPTNIMITDDGQAKILDFGLAKTQLFHNGDQPGTTLLTGQGTILGTPPYMSPEQVLGRAADVRSDVFSLGAVLYTMITGRPPFTGASPAEIIHAVAYEPIAPTEKVRSGVPRTLARAIDRALSKDPDERFATIEEFSTALRCPGTIPASSKRSWLVAAVTFVFTLAALWVGAPRVSQRLDSVFRGWTLPEVRHLAVLPFRLVGAFEERRRDAETRALADGLLETVTSKLTLLEEFHGRLLVVPASEILAGDVHTATTAAEIFGVNLAVSGALQPSEQGFRLTLNLIDARTQRQLRSDVIDHNNNDLVQLQDKACRSLARLLEMELGTDVLTVLAAGIETEPSAYDYYLKARGLLQRSDKPQNVVNSIAAFNRSIDEDPTLAPAWAGLGEALLVKYREGERLDPSLVEEARAACDEALRLDPLLDPVQTTLGALAYETGAYEESIGHYERALEQNPRNAEALRGLGRSLAKTGKIEKAETTYLRAVEVGPYYWKLHNTLGAYYLRQGRFAEAEESFRRVIELSPDNPKGYSNLGAAYLYQDRLEEARNQLQRSIEIAADSEAFSNLAYIHFRLGRYAEAAELYEQVLNRYGGGRQVLFNLAASLENAGAGEKADGYYRQALALAQDQKKTNPNDPVLLLEMGQLEARVGDPSLAPSLLERALKQAPDDVEMQVAAAEVYEQLGRRGDAVRILKRAVSQGYPLERLQANAGLQGLSASDFEALVRK